MNRINIFILAAGLGERLRPITYHIPKPLIPILGKPILQYILDNVSALTFHKIGINLHHKKEFIKEWLAKCSLSEKITLFSEETTLGTGGALKNAERFLNTGTFLVHNADIFSNIDLGNLLEHHLSSRNLVTLAVHDYPEFNNLVIDEKGFLKDVKKTQDLSGLAFTGIAVYEPEFLKFISAGVSSVVDAWLNATSASYRIGTVNVSGCCWSDIGTPSAYISAGFDTLRAEGEIIYIHPSVKSCKGIDLQGFVVIEDGNVLGEGISLKNCILLPESGIEIKDIEINSPIHVGAIHELSLQKWGDEGLLFENCIIGSDFKIDLNESDILGISAVDGKQLIGTGGSDRKYYRVRKDNKSEVLMECKGDDPDFERHIEYTRFFLKHSIPVPELMKVESEKMQAVFEDAGDISLYSYLKCPREKTDIENIYRQVIRVVTLIHAVATGYVSECPLLQKRVFNYEYFRWETDYFMKRFVEGIRNMKIKNTSELKKEFHYLALRANSSPKTVIHRDLQSQNIMIMKGQKLRLIDFQGARLGPPAYDVASLLWDPYYCLEENMRVRLLDYYINQMNIIPPRPLGTSRFQPLVKGGRRDYDEKDFRDSLLSCRLQRHMQALGAYGFLSSVKGKKYFLKYVPEGLRLLKEDISLSKNEYPELYKLLMDLQRNIS